jgi:hypothetical protein
MKDQHSFERNLIDFMAIHGIIGFSIVFGDFKGDKAVITANNPISERIYGTFFMDIDEELAVKAGLQDEKTISLDHTTLLNTDETKD